MAHVSGTESSQTEPCPPIDGSGDEEICVDLTEIKGEIFSRLYSQLKQVNKYGQIIDTQVRPCLTYETLNEIPIVSTIRSREATRLFTETWLSPNHIKTHFSLNSDKEALELIIDEIWSKNGQVNQFSFVTLMKEVKARIDDIQLVRDLLQNEITSVSDVGLLLCTTLLDPSVLEVVLAVLYMESINSPLYKEILDKHTEFIYSDDEVEIDQEELVRLVDEAMTELQPELEKNRQPGLDKLSEIEKSAEDFEKQLDEMTDFVESVAKQAEDESVQFKKAVREAPVTVIDESMPQICELLPSKYRIRAERLMARGNDQNEEIHVIDANLTTPENTLSRFVPDFLPTLHRGDKCWAQIGQGLLRKATFTSENNSLNQCCIRIDGDVMSCMVVPENLAYDWLPSWILLEGTRVAARHQTQKQIFLPGIIAEKASALNKMRYLVFFDDSSTGYVMSEDVRLMYVQGKLGQKLAWRDGWKLVDKDPSLRQFLERYLKAYPTWAMCTVRKQGDRILVFGNNEWHSAYVSDVDCHMVQIRYPHTENYEWLYRGSLRFGEVLKRNAETSRSRRLTQSRNVLEENNIFLPKPISLAAKGSHEQLQVAKKRTVFRRDEEETDSSSNDESRENRSSRIEELKDEPESLPSIEEFSFQPHKCGVGCIKANNQSDEMYIGKSPFIVPLLQGWNRQKITGSITNNRRAIHKIVYMTPCGRRLRSERDVNIYLRDTISRLTIDMFTFDSQVHIERKMISITKPLMEDYSLGREALPITVVNARTDEKPVVIEYQARRFPANDAVKLLTIDGNFCSGCSCIDDCSDSSKCECQLLTQQSIERLHPSLRPKKKIIGYENRRLRCNILSGIFECNAKCRCKKKKCFNRVVQQPLRVPLQLFKTEAKGWGLRVLIDVPAGQFVCIYSGAIWTNEQAEALGTTSDEYFADLDLIDVVLDEKEDIGVEYMDDPLADEGIATEDDNGDDSKSQAASNGSDSDYGASDDEEYLERKNKTPSPIPSEMTDAIASTSTTDIPVELVPSISDTSDNITAEPDVLSADIPVMVSAPINLINCSIPTTDALNIKKGWDMMDYLGGKESFGFTVDARTRGNIGRFLNHSCDPNVFVQNVLVDTHDLRLPWVAFFAIRRIRAGEELCWNYNYRLDPNRPKECNCGSEKCRGRLM